MKINKKINPNIQSGDNFVESKNLSLIFQQYVEGQNVNQKHPACIECLEKKGSFKEKIQKSLEISVSAHCAKAQTGEMEV